MNRPLKQSDPVFYALASLVIGNAPTAKKHLTKLRGGSGADKKDYLGIDINAAISHCQVRMRTGVTGRGLPVSSSAELLQEQVIQLQATAETYYNISERLRQNAGGVGIGGGFLQTQVSTLQLELDQVYKSKSWRITAPLRGFRRLIKLKQDG